MVIFVVLVLMVLAIALYDFFVSRAWHDLLYAERNTQSAALRERHRRANAIRKAYNRVMLIIVACISALAVSGVVANKTFGGGGNATEPPKPYDTIQLTLEAPPMEHIETLPESYKLEGNAAIDQSAQDEKRAQEGRDRPDDGKPSRNNGGSNNPTEKASTTPNNTPTILKNKTDQEIYNQGQNTYEEMKRRGEERARQREQQKLDAAKRRQEGNKNPDPNKPPPSKSGTADVDWDHSWRKAFQNRDDNVRTPKYTCPSGVSGKVKIKVRVNSNGDVITATPLTSGVDQCLIDQALLYARTKSRFETSSKEIDEGILTYTFYP